MNEYRIGSISDLASFVRDALDGDAIGIDTETTGLDVFSGDVLRGVSLSSSREPGGLYFPVSHPDTEWNHYEADVRKAVQAIVDSGCVLCWWHCCFDWAVLAHLGVENIERFPFVDGQVFMWLFDENRDLSLKGNGVQFFGVDADAEERAKDEWWTEQCREQRARISAAKRRYTAATKDQAREGTPSHKGRAISRAKDDPFDIEYDRTDLIVWGAQMDEERWKADDKWARFPATVLGPYAAQDAYLTRALAQHFGLLEPGKWLTGYQRELEVQQVLYRMTTRGADCDLETLDAAHEQFTSRMAEIEKQFEGKIDNLGSAKQKCAYLYGTLGLEPLTLTEKGKPSASAGALDDYPDVPEVQLLREYAQCEQGVKMYTEPMRRFLRGGTDGKLHTHFSSTRTVTGRIASSGPNLMNLPRESSLAGVVKSAFHARPGRQIYKFDLASAELRVIASHTRDPRLTAIILEGRRLHAETSEAIFGTAEEPYYTTAKNINFSIPYEAGAVTLSKYVIKAGLPRAGAIDMAQRYIEGHKAMFPTLHAAKDALTAAAKRLGKIPLHKPGRYRHFRSPGNWDPRYYTALNAITQGGIGEMVKDVMLEVEGFGEEPLPFADTSMVLQVHDELWFEGPDIEGLGEDILSYLNRVTARINPFRLPMFWEKK